MALQQNSGAPRLQGFLELCLHLFKRTPVRKQEALKAHFQRYHKVTRDDWLRELANTVGSSNLKALNTLAKQGGGEAVAAPLGSLPAHGQQDNSQDVGVSAALSDLLHAGMTAMRARAQQSCLPASSDGPHNTCVKAEPGASQTSAADAGAIQAAFGHPVRPDVLRSAQQQQPRRLKLGTRGIRKRHRKVAGHFSFRR